jgi:hypothetical protein
MIIQSEHQFGKLSDILLIIRQKDALVCNFALLAHKS